jgi:hypothetical protein
MSLNFHYDTAAKAILELQNQGYLIDFNLNKNRLIGPGDQYHVDDFQIRDIYRYEGNSDPADEVIIYALESNNGDKGIFVDGYGVSTDPLAYQIIERLKKANL